MGVGIGSEMCVFYSGKMFVIRELQYIDRREALVVEDGSADLSSQDKREHFTL